MNNQQKLAWLDKHIHGHITAKKILINMFNRIETRYAQIQTTGISEIKIPSVFLIGGSGTGKTYLTQKTAQLFKLPFLVIDATTLGPAGSSSKSATKIAKDVADWAENITKTNPVIYPTVDSVLSRAVLFLDELDKLGISHDSSGNWHKMTQATFLTMLADEQVSFVFAGAFSDNNNLKESQPTKQLGFTANTAIPSTEMPDLAEKVIKAGIIPELAGRIGSFCLLDTLTAESYQIILNEILIPELNKTFDALGRPRITLTDEFKEDICFKAAKGLTGVRYLKQRLSERAVDHEFESEIQSSFFDLEQELRDNCDFLDIQFIDK